MSIVANFAKIHETRPSTLPTNGIVALCAAMLVSASAFGASTAKPASVVIDTSSAKGEVIQQSTYYSGFNASKAFDGNYADDSGRWMALTNNLPAWYVYKFNEATEVRGLRLRTKSSSRAPKAWTFKGSYTGEDGTWVDLVARSGETWSYNEVRDYTLENIAAYQYYKFTCSQNNGDGYMELRETEFLSICVADITTANAGDIVSQSPEFVYNGVHYAAKAAFNNNKLFSDGSRWIATMPAGGAYVVYRFNAPTRVNGISLTIPNYGTQTTRAPKDWTFSGSDDGETWTVLDTQTGETGWASGGEERYYKFTNTHSYQYYKFNCTATNGDTVMQLVEIEFYYSTAPSLGECSVQYASDTSCTVSAKVAENGADRVYWILSDDGVTTTTNQFATSVSEGGTVTGTITGLTANKTYAVGVLAESGAGSDVVLAGFLYTGELSLGAVVNANESGLVQGTVEVSRPTADVLPLTVTYTISGSSGTDGVTWETTVTVMIPAGETTGYLVVNPLLDLTVAENVTATVALSGSNYAIPAEPDNAKSLTIVNSDVPDGFDVLTITNAFDNPKGGYFTSLTANTAAITNAAGGRIIRFVRPDDAQEGLREFFHYQASEGNVEFSSTTFPHDWMFYTSFNVVGTGTTVDSVRYAAETISSGQVGKRSVRAYSGSWYIPEGKAGTYSFRMHMLHAGLFSIDGKQLLRQFSANAVTTNGVALSAGWHTIYVALVADSSKKIGPASGETLGLSFSAGNATLTKDAPGSAFGPFDSASGYKFSTAFGAVLVPSMEAKGGDVFIDCANVLGDLRIAGQLGHSNHSYTIVNLPAGRTVEVGRPAYYNLSGWQDCVGFAAVDWDRTTLPAGVNVRFEGAAVVSRSWTSAGHGVWSGDNHSAFSLGKTAIIATDVPNLLGTYTDEFHYPDGLRVLIVGDSSVLGTTAKIYVPSYMGFAFGGAPFVFSGSGANRTLPMKRSSSSWKLPNEIEVASGAVINGSMSSSSGDEYHGDISAANAEFRVNGWARFLTMCGSVQVKNLVINQRGDRICFKPKTGSAPSSVSGTVTLSSENAVKSKSGWNYQGSTFFYCPETPEEHPMSIGTVTANNAYLMPGNDAYIRQGATLTTCSNNTINVGTLTGGGVHLLPKFPQLNSEKDAGFANFVFGEINSNVTTNEMKVFVASNVNITVTNIVKKTGEGLPAVVFDYTLVSNGVNLAVGPNAGFLDIEGNCPTSVIKALDVAMLPGRIKGFIGDITLTDTTENRTYNVVYDFDRGVAIGGCDGSGNLAAAPSTGTINLSFTGTPKNGTFGILRFDSTDVSLENWNVTLSDPKYEGHTITVMKAANGFSFKLHVGLSFTIR